MSLFYGSVCNVSIPVAQSQILRVTMATQPQVGVKIAKRGVKIFKPEVASFFIKKFFKEKSLGNLPLYYPNSPKLLISMAQ